MSTETIDLRDLGPLGYPGYLISSDGSMWSDRAIGRGRKAHSRRKLATYAGNHGYRMATLSYGNRPRCVAIHRLLLRAFVGEPRPKQEARHLDGDKANNSLSNLAWGSRSENMRDRDRHGTSNHGERNGQTKLVAAQVLSIRQEVASGTHRQAVAEKYKVHVNTIHNIIAGRVWGSVK